MHVTLDFVGKHCRVIFFCCFVFRFREIMHANMAANGRFADSIVWKTKALFGKDSARKKLFFVHIICGKQKRNQQTKIEGYVFL